MYCVKNKQLAAIEYKIMRNNPLFSINPSLFRAFLAVAKHKSFTVAADSLYKTQSNISRQVSELEKQLGVKLFNRTSKDVGITEAGQEFVSLFKQQLEILDKIYGKAINEVEGYSGKVNYAMPLSCLLSPHSPLLLDKHKAFPELEINVELGSNEFIFEKILNTQADFGFVTKKINNPVLTYQPFCQEEYVLVGRPHLMAELSLESLSEQKFVSYPGMDVYFNLWRKHFAREGQLTDAREIYYAGNINVIEGAIIMVKKGVGLSVFPSHCVASLIESGELVAFTPNASDPLLNWVYLVRKKSDIVPKRVELVIEWFLEVVRNKT